jgi:hypothetical protein
MNFVIRTEYPCLIKGWKPLYHPFLPSTQCHRKKRDEDENNWDTLNKNVLTRPAFEFERVCICMTVFMCVFV